MFTSLRAEFRFDLLAFKENLSVAQNICGTFLNEFAPLSREPEFLLREELQGLQKFQAVLDTLAVGRQSLRDVGKALGVQFCARSPINLKRSWTSAMWTGNFL